jgi:hypothetical protein
MRYLAVQVQIVGRPVSSTWGELRFGISLGGEAVVNDVQDHG